MYMYTITSLEKKTHRKYFQSDRIRDELFICIRFVEVIRTRKIDKQKNSFHSREAAATDDLFAPRESGLTKIS